jgi:hypothetical protein
MAKRIWQQSHASHYSLFHGIQSLLLLCQIILYCSFMSNVPKNILLWQGGTSFRRPFIRAYIPLFIHHAIYTVIKMSPIRPNTFKCSFMRTYIHWCNHMFWKAWCRSVNNTAIQSAIIFLILFTYRSSLFIGVFCMRSYCIHIFIQSFAVYLFI